MFFHLEISPSSEGPSNVFLPFLGTLTPVIWALTLGPYMVRADCLNSDLWSWTHPLFPPV